MSPPGLYEDALARHEANNRKLWLCGRLCSRSIGRGGERLQRSDCSLPPLADQFPLNPSNRKLVRQGRDESRVEEDPFVKYQVAEPEIVGIAPSGITVALAELAG